jgi:hypothetical protein
MVIQTIGSLFFLFFVPIYCTHLLEELGGFSSTKSGLSRYDVSCQPFGDKISLYFVIPLFTCLDFLYFFHCFANCCISLQTPFFALSFVELWLATMNSSSSILYQVLKSMLPSDEN